MAEDPPPLQTPILLLHRDDHMISPTGGSSTFRNAQFLQPTAAASIQGPSMKLPSLPPTRTWPLKVSFNGWRNPLQKWKPWVHTMHSRHAAVWKQAGVYDAIMASTLKIHRKDELVFALAERWSPQTNTFFFPWGESTITLEDILILAGLPVLGDPVSSPLQTEQDFKIEQRLIEILGSLKNDTHCHWLKMFINSGSEIEHEAFLSLWLCRYVFPGNQFDKISNHMFSIAVHLSKGRRLAIGPSVLANIYRDLGLLKGLTDSVSSNVEDDTLLYLSLWSPLWVVQVWAWERLLPLRPEPKPIGSGEVRLARWGGLKGAEVGCIRRAIDLSGATFVWRPYALAVENWTFPSFYRENGEMIRSGDMSLEFVRCLRASQLVGMDCIECYNPHRVAMQFGFDQDLPAWISWKVCRPEDAWSWYNKAVNEDEVVYLPARLFEADVTVRYLKWWRETVLCLCASQTVMGRRRRSPPNQRPRQSYECLMMDGNADPQQDFSTEVSLSFPEAKCFPEAKSVKIEDWDSGDFPVLKKTKLAAQEHQLVAPNLDDIPEFPPGFEPKQVVATSDLMLVPPGFEPTNEGNDELPLVPLGFEPKHDSAGNSQSSRTCNASRKTCCKESHLLNNVLVFNQAAEEKPTDHSVEINSEQVCNNLCKLGFASLEARLTNLERIFAALKTGTLRVTAQGTLQILD